MFSLFIIKGKIESDPTQVGSFDPRMSRLLHPAAYDYSVAIPRSRSYVPARYLTFDYLMTHASTSAGFELLKKGTRWVTPKSPGDILSRFHVQKPSLSNFVSWFFDLPVLENKRK